MDCKRVGLGVMTWFLGMLIPTMHHALLHWPVATTPTSNVITRMTSMYKYLPMADDVYLIAMAVVGAILIVSGLKADARN